MDKTKSGSNQVINGIKLSSKCCRCPCVLHLTPVLDEPDATKVITVTANDGKTGEPREISYSNYKVIGNGSFGVVFQAKFVENGDSAAIKKVLQDKRFKVPVFSMFAHSFGLILFRTVSFKSCDWFPTQTLLP